MVSQKITFFVASDFNIFLPAIKIAIEKNGGELTAIQSKPSRVSIKRNLKKHHAQVLILNQKEQPSDHSSLIKQIKQANPQIRIISIVNNSLDIHRVLKSQVDGILWINESFDELIKTIKIVTLGQNYYSPKVSQVMAQEMKTKQNLTSREMEVFNLLSKDRSRDEITQRLKISRSTLRAHIRNIKSKSKLEPIRLEAIS